VALGPGDLSQGSFPFPRRPGGPTDEPRPMVHAVKFTWKLGFGLVRDKNAAKVHAALEVGYLIGSLLFTVGTVYFFPVEWLEDFETGCKYYEVGSLIFTVLTFYMELDRYCARKRGGRDIREREDGGPADVVKTPVTVRELLEEAVYCLGSFVFLVGTFLFDPPIVRALEERLPFTEKEIYNAAAVLFMVGSFLFSLGAYINALSIFEAPKIFRSHLISVTTCYEFGGLLFVAGTMGYVEAFEPNRTMRWVATWFYFVGCMSYVAGSFLAFVTAVAGNQVRWERLKKEERRKKRSIAGRIGRASTAIPRALIRRARKKPSPKGTEEASCEGAGDDADDGIGLAELGRALQLVQDAERLDINVAECDLAEHLSAALGPQVGQELAAALRGEEDDEEEDGVFGAFWRAVGGPREESPEPSAQGSDPTPAMVGAPAQELRAIAAPAAHGEEGAPSRERDDLSLMENRA